MSRYGVDKVCWQIAMDDGRRDRFLENPAGYLIGYDDLITPDERRSLTEMDFVALYRMGTNPFLLIQWTARVHPNRGNPDFRKWYAESVAPYGRPDFAT